MVSVNGPGSSVDAQARRWLLLMDPGPATPAQRAAFETWLRAHPDHRAAYEDARRVWRGIGRLQHLRGWIREETVDVPRQPQPKTHAPDGVRARSWRAPAWSAAAALVVVAIGIARLFGPGEEYSTAVGGIDRVTLPDGSEVVLGAKTDITVRFTSKERRVTLLTGEAFFDVTKDMDRPFLVAVDDQLVRAVGTQFEVHRGAGRIRVAVVEGVVEVSGPPLKPLAGRAQATGTGYKTLLEAGQQYVASRVEVINDPVRPISADETASWRVGRLFYESATLGEVVNDISRYYPHPIEIGSVEVRNLKITGSFQLQRIDDLFENLEQTLPIEIERHADGTIALEPRPLK